MGSIKRNMVYTISLGVKHAVGTHIREVELKVFWTAQYIQKSCMSQEDCTIAHDGRVFGASMMQLFYACRAMMAGALAGMQCIIIIVG